MVTRMYATKIRSCRRLADLTCVGKSTIARWIAGNPLCNRVDKTRRARKLTSEVMTSVANHVRENPFCTRASLVGYVRTQLRAAISESSAGVALRSLGYSRKRTFQRVEKPGLNDQRAAYRTRAMAIDPSKVDSIDESAFWFDMKPVYGYSPRGKRLSVKAAPNKQRRWSLIMAVSNDRVVGARVKAGSINGADVADFVGSMDLSGYEHLLFDNAAIHKTTVVAKALERAGVQALFLSPYSPQYHRTRLRHDQGALSVLSTGGRTRCRGGLSTSSPNLYRHVDVCGPRKHVPSMLAKVVHGRV